MVFVSERSLVNVSLKAPGMGRSSRCRLLMRQPQSELNLTWVVCCGRFAEGRDGCCAGSPGIIRELQIRAVEGIENLRHQLETDTFPHAKLPVQSEIQIHIVEPETRIASDSRKACGCRLNSLASRYDIEWIRRSVS